MSNITKFPGAQAASRDLVNHPPHYTSHPSGVECIDIIENLPCNPANVVKYVWRQGLGKDSDSDPKAHPINKARWYKEREKTRRVIAMNQALSLLQRTGDAGALVGLVGSLVNTVDLLLEAIIVMGSTNKQLAIAQGLLQPTPPELLGAPEGTATQKAWDQTVRKDNNEPLRPGESPELANNERTFAGFDHCHTGDECGEKGACGTPGDPGLKTDADLLDTPNGDDRATELPEPVQLALALTTSDEDDIVGQQQEAEAADEEIAYDSAKDPAAKPAGYATEGEVIPALVEDVFALNWNQVARGVHNNACQKGFWDKRQELTAAVNSSCGAGSAESGHVHDLIASQCFDLIHSEISEALEGLRQGNPYEQGLENVRSVEAELADAVIRIMDTAAAFRWDVAGAIVKKIKFNAARPRMHGGKRF